MNCRINRIVPRALFFALGILLICSCATPGTNPDVSSRNRSIDGGGVASVNNAIDQQLEKLMDQGWQRTLQENPTFASRLGDMRYNHLWTDNSLAAFEASHQKDLEDLARLEQINVTQLSPAAALNFELFKHEYQKRIANYPFKRFLAPMNQRGGIQNVNQLADSIPFQTREHFEHWIARLRSFGAYMDTTIELMRKGIDEGVVHPRIIMQRLPAQVEAHILDNAQESSFFKPFKQQPDTISNDEFEHLKQQAAQAIDQTVIPAYQKLKEFLDNEYLPATRETVGIWDSPNGTQYYAQRVRDFTTTDLSPDEVHEIGLSEVSRIRGEMQQIIDELGFEGSFADFLMFLRTDPQFYHDTPEALMQDYLATSKRIDPELVKLFKVLPRTPYGLKAIPDAIAPDTTTAYYSRPAADGTRAGYYFVNLYRPEVRPKYEIEVLTVHEAMPGHHLQIALAQELGDLPDFRRYGGYTAFIEGWGLYSESLGSELGLYKDPYSKFGQLTYEMWRAVRLVVDTGLHHKKWSRQQAIDFFKANAAKTEHDIVNEIDRYIAWPGQALAYKIGELKIKELRQRSELALGDQFDIRDFHHVVLGSGAIPLSELEKNVNQWIEQTR